MDAGAARARIIAFESALQGRRAVTVAPWAHGDVVLDARHPRVYDANLLRVTGTAPGLTATELISACDRILGAAGFAHRRAQIADEVVAARLEPGLRAAGWMIERHVLMGLIRAPDRPAGVTAEEVARERMDEVREASLRESPFEVDAALIAQLREIDALTAELVVDRCFGIVDGDRVVSGCHLYSDGSVAQVEDVSTLPEFRGRGYARAVVSAAIEAATAGGHDVIFIVADADDWPLELYARLGFDAVGTVLLTTRP